MMTSVFIPEATRELPTKERTAFNYLIEPFVRTFWHGIRPRSNGCLLQLSAHAARRRIRMRVA
jgi:hypothetical protein